MASSRFPATVDDVTVRLIAGIVLLVSTTALVTGHWWLLAVLALDFTLRAGWGPRRSPIAQVAQRLVRPYVTAAPRPTAGAPKRFAATIGAVLTTVATLAWVTSLATGAATALTVTIALTVVMVAFPALEAGLGVCVGCIVYRRLMAWGLVPEEACVDCADITRRRVALS